MRAFVLAVLLILGALPSPAPAAEPPAAPGRLRIQTRDWLLLGGGVAAAGLGEFVLSPRTREVPPGGLDPAGIGIGWDRRSLGRTNTGARGGSDAFLAAAAMTPVLVFWSAAPGGGRMSAGLRGLRVQSEAVAVASGAALLLKDLVSRPRPFTYLPGRRRPPEPAYAPASDAAFESFPSGHSTLAWASSMSGVAWLATARPDLPARAHFAAGVLAGGLATTVSLLRVESGVHFPTDVAAGAALGAGSGVGVALLHAGPVPAGGSRGRAWRAGLSGVAAGIGLGLLLCPPTSPWIH